MEKEKLAMGPREGIPKLNLDFTKKVNLKLKKNQKIKPCVLKDEDLKMSFITSNAPSFVSPSHLKKDGDS